MAKEIESELPTVAEELNRKTFAEIENLMLRHELGQITTAEYRASMNTLFAICSGLVDREFFEIISQAGAEIEIDYSFSQKRLFRRGENITIMSVASDEGVDFPLIALSAKIFDEKNIAGDSDEITEKVTKFAAKLQSAGFEEIY